MASAQAWIRLRDVRESLEIGGSETRPICGRSPAFALARVRDGVPSWPLLSDTSSLRGETRGRLSCKRVSAAIVGRNPERSQLVT